MWIRWIRIQIRIRNTGKHHAVVVSVPGNRVIPLVPFPHLIHRSVGRAVVRRAVVSNPMMLKIILNFCINTFLDALKTYGIF
jgi:hypothetical protein